MKNIEKIIKEINKLLEESEQHCESAAEDLMKGFILVSVMLILM